MFPTLGDYNMGTLDNSDIRLFNMTFDVYNQKPHYMELKSKSG